jgi:uncharacterized protein DUF6868
MTIATLRSMLMWCTIINVGMLTLWFGMFTLAGGWIYRMHSKWFKISRETSDTMHYAGMGLFKLAIFIFNLVPWLALMIVG